MCVLELLDDMVIHDDWAFTFKRMQRSVRVGAYEFTFNQSLDISSNLSGDMRHMMCQACAGEAMSLVRAVPGFEGSTRSTDWEAMRAKGDGKGKMVERLGNLTNVKDVEQAIVMWEERLTVFQ